MIWSFCLPTVLVCSTYLEFVLGMVPSISFNPKKSVIVIAPTKEDHKLNIPSFYLTDQVLNVGSKVKYLGHILRNDLYVDDDVKRQCCKLYMQANILAPSQHLLSGHSP